MQEMFLIQIEDEKKCSISSYDTIRGRRYIIIMILFFLILETYHSSFIKGIAAKMAMDGSLSLKTRQQRQSGGHLL